ncbi:alpha/beta fold hydrolase [Mesorhizobium australicum]|uniref:Pimeloyl-ACP methyl ester carboxylesterase n=1 Tax=Mesorhizobium australicum TaxID=536018 RepID=A0A1X7N4C6_9HYPH|nr:alpha/beta hydrolase [Mesorhizobium australicum]SMH32124.1 Pimeloyl-ACP methyl ester carboxylesterase [Mesorhizobium australicum]
MTGPRSTYVTAAGFEVHVTEWGNPNNPALVMWHGLARTGRDFDEAARALSDTYFVLCPDTIGRGLSSWARRPEVDYSYRSFGDTALGILDHYGIDRLRWIGTSMGGLIGVTLAAGRLKERISHLVINDIGPDIPEAGTGRIATYVGSPPVYETVAEMDAWLRRNYAPFGPNSDAFWQRMVDTSVRRTDAGKVTVHYDPAIVTQFTHHKADLDVWDAYDAITAPTLLLRGETSDVLAAPVAATMTQRGPRPRLVEFPGIGHAPTLATAAEIDLLRQFLAG